MNNTLISHILKTSKNVKNSRNLHTILSKCMEEIAELSVEVNIETGLSNKNKGEDGIKGEAIDAIITLVDLIYLYDENVTENELIEIASLKLNKWVNSLRNS